MSSGDCIRAALGPVFLLALAAASARAQTPADTLEVARAAVQYAVDRAIETSGRREFTLVLNRSWSEYRKDDGLPTPVEERLEASMGMVPGTLDELKRCPPPEAKRPCTIPLGTAILGVSRPSFDRDRAVIVVGRWMMEAGQPHYDGWKLELGKDEEGDWIVVDWLERMAT